MFLQTFLTQPLSPVLALGPAVQAGHRPQSGRRHFGHRPHGPRPGLDTTSAGLLASTVFFANMIFFLVIVVVMLGLLGFMVVFSFE